MRRLARAAAGAIATLAAFLVLAEGLSRLLHRPAPVRRVYDPFAWRIAQPDLDDTFTNAQGETVRIRLNELGLRGPRLSEPVAAGTLTLVFLGGSAVENYAWNEADTFPAIAAARVERRLGRPVRAFNGGVSAAVSATTLGRLQHQALDLRPSLVVVMDGLNDLVGGFHPGFRRDGRHLPRPPAADARPRSYLFDRLRSLGPPRRRGPKAAPRTQQLADYAGFPARQVFERNLRSMAAIAEAHGLPILFLTQPTSYRDRPEPEDLRRYYLMDSLVEAGLTPPDVPSLVAGMRAFNATVLALRETRPASGRAPAGGVVQVFDLAARVPKSYDLFLDECHFTKAGNRRVAEEIVPLIEAVLRAAP